MLTDSRASSTRISRAIDDDCVEPFLGRGEDGLDDEGPGSRASCALRISAGPAPVTR